MSRNCTSLKLSKTGITYKTRILTNSTNTFRDEVLEFKTATRVDCSSTGEKSEDQRHSKHD